MKKINRILAIILAAALTVPFVSCFEKEQELPELNPFRKQQFWHEGEKEENERFTAFTGEVFHKALQNDALNLHFTVRNLADYGFTRPEMNLFAKSELDAEEVLKELNNFRFSSLSRENQITYQIMKEDFTDALKAETLAPLISPFSYDSGFQTELVTIATEYDFYEEADVADYLTLLSQVPDYFSALLETEEERVEEGYGYPDFLLEKIISQFKDVYSEGEESPFITSFNEKMDAFEGLTASEKREYQEENKALVMEEVLPSYDSTAAAIEKFLGKGEGDGRLCMYSKGNGEGEEYYRYLMKAKSGYTGEVFDLFEELDNFYHSASNELLTLISSFSGYSQFERWQSGDAVTPTSPEEILSFYSKNLSSLFPEIAESTYSVKYLSEGIAKTMPNTLAYYRIPQIDNYQNGVITVNPLVSRESEMMNTICHEGYPGHFYQNVYFLSKNPDPVRSIFNFSGYSEGWAVYAANRAARVYPYPSDASLFYHFDEILSAINYALYALADIGAHYYGWDAEAISDRFGVAYEAAEGIYETVVECPGVYLSYGVGTYEMYTLRSTARAYCYGNLDEVEFHTFLLDVGPCNFSLLFSLLEEYYVETASIYKGGSIEV